MKANVFTSIFGLATLVASSLAFAAPAPKLTPIRRIQTVQSYAGMPKMIRDSAGLEVLVQLQEVPGRTDILQLVAINEQGQTVAGMDVSHPKPGEGILIDDVAVNAAGEIVAIVEFGDVKDFKPELYSDNLTKKTSMRLLDVGKFPRFESRLRVNGQNLALVTADLDAGPNNTHPQMVRIVDEDRGDVIGQKILDNAVTGKLGLDKQGRLKALLTGYEIFGVLDVASGAYVDLAPPRVQPSVYPGEVNLITGRFITLQDKNQLDLLDPADLLNGQYRPVQSLPPGTGFIGGEPATIAVERTGNQILLVDLKTGQPLGPALSSLPAGRDEDRVEDLIQTPQVTIAVLSHLKVPNSFMPGTVLTYVNVKTGRVLRTNSVDKYTMTAQLMDLGGGRIGSLEITDAVGNPSYQTVDIGNNTVLNSSAGGLIGKAFPSGTGRMVALQAGGNNQLCVVDLLDNQAVTCVQDALIKPAVKFGYTPFGVSPAKMQVPLLGTEVSLHFPSLGYAEFRVD
jgi:hypothetical protein